MLVGYMYTGIGVTIKEYNIKVNLLPLELHDFNLIPEMDWLSTCKAQTDYFAKMVTFQGLNGNIVIFRGEMDVISSSIIPAMKHVEERVYNINCLCKRYN